MKLKRWFFGSLLFFCLPLCGFAATTTDKASFDFIADIGAAHRSFNWETIPAFFWKFSDTYTAAAGYRLLHINYREDDFKIDASMHGPIIGVRITF